MNLVGVSKLSTSVGKNLTAGGDTGFGSGSYWGNWITDITGAVTSVIQSIKSPTGTVAGSLQPSGGGDEDTGANGDFIDSKTVLWVGAGLLVLILLFFVAPKLR